MQHENSENRKGKQKIEQTSSELALLDPKVSAVELFLHCKELNRKMKEVRNHGSLSDVTDLRISCEQLISRGGHFSEQIWELEKQKLEIRCSLDFFTLILFSSPVFPHILNRFHDEDEEICKFFRIATVNSVERIELDLMFQEFMKLCKLVYCGFAK